MLDPGVGKSKHSAAPKSQLWFAQVPHPKGVFTAWVRIPADVREVHMEMESRKNRGRAFSSPVGTRGVWEGAQQARRLPAMRREGWD